jgi:hypothetical protein
MAYQKKTPASSFQEFEAYVASLYTALGYTISHNVNVGGNQIDLFCDKYIDGFRRTRILVECKYRTDDGVGVDDTNKFFALATNQISLGKISGGAIVTNTHFSKEAKQIIGDHALIALKTIADLESELFDFSHLYNISIFDYEHEEIYLTYVSSSAKRKDLSLVDREHCDLVDETLHRRLVEVKPSLSIVLADFGGGKSTLLQALYYRMSKSAVLDPKAKRPVFIELKNASLYATIEEFFLAALPGDLPRHMSKARFNFLRSSGRFCFFLDGFDELRLPDFDSQRARRLIEILEFIGAHSSIVISCRPTYFATEAELKETLTGLIESRQILLHQLFRRTDPNKERANRLLSEVTSPLPVPLKNRNISVYYLDTFDDDKIRSFISNFIGRDDCPIKHSVDEIHRFLVSVYDISDLIKRPLLLHIIMKMIELDVIRPERDQDLGGAAAIYSLYIESCVSREFDKGASRAVLSKVERRHLCQIIALLMVRLNNLQVSWADIMRHVAQEAFESGAIARKFDSFSLDDIAADIRVCSFLRFGDDGTLRFAHKSFMEFLIAQFIFEQNLDRTNHGSLTILLSQEMLFFLSEFAKVNFEFAGRVCVGRTLQATRKPKN